MPYKHHQWIGRRLRCRVNRELAGHILGFATLMPLAGCGGLGDLGALAGLVPLLPSEEELAAFDREVEDFNNMVDELPSVAIRIINDTTEAARVQLVSGLAGPRPDELFGFEALSMGAGLGDQPLNEIDSKHVVVSAAGTAVGRVKCGEVIGVSVEAPADGFGVLPYSDGSFGLYVDAGNVRLSGIGVSHDTFEGDVIGARFIRPQTDGLDCETGVLVVRIESGASTSDDPDTGIENWTFGTGSLSIEDN